MQLGKKRKMKIGFWNVRTLRVGGELLQIMTTLLEPPRDFKARASQTYLHEEYWERSLEGKNTEWSVKTVHRRVAVTCSDWHHLCSWNRKIYTSVHVTSQRTGEARVPSPDGAGVNAPYTRPSVTYHCSSVMNTLKDTTKQSVFKWRLLYL